MLPICAAIHDLSCYAKSSLTVVLPVLEAMGVETCPLPTALLSSQTDGFDSYYFYDTSKQMDGILEAWTNLGLTFDAIYSGFLGNKEQVETIRTFAKEQRKISKPLVLVDPVLGDDFALYGPITKEHVKAMRALVAEADVITPNTTEAALLLDIPFCEQFTEAEALKWARKLSLQTHADVAITSVPLIDGYAVACCAKDSSFLIPYRHFDASFPGCGDLFASLLLGYLLRKHDFQTSVTQAVEMTSLAIERTLEAGFSYRHGVSPTLIMDALVKKNG